MDMTRNTIRPITRYALGLAFVPGSSLAATRIPTFLRPRYTQNFSGRNDLP